MQLYICKTIVSYGNLTVKLIDIVYLKNPNILKPIIYSTPTETDMEWFDSKQGIRHLL